MSSSKAIIFMGIVALTIPQAKSQDITNNPAFVGSTIRNIVAGGSMFRSFDNRFKGTRGDVKLFEQYIPGKIFMTQGQIVDFKFMNYDAYGDELLVKRDGTESIVTLDLVNRFVLETEDGDTLSFIRLIGPEARNGFYLKIATYPNVSVYKKVYKVYIPPNYQGAYSSGRDYAEFVQEEKFMFTMKGVPLTEFKNRKSLLAHFTNQKQAIEKYIKQESIDFKNEADMRNLFYFIDQQLN